MPDDPVVRPTAAAPPEPPHRKVLRRVAQALFFFAASGFAAVIGGSFLAELTFWTALAVAGLSAFAAVLGVLIEILNDSRP